MTVHLFPLFLITCVSLATVAGQLPANNPVTEPWIWPIPQEWQRGNSSIQLSNDLNFIYNGSSVILERAITRYNKLIYLNDDYPMIPYNWSTTDSAIISILENIEVHITDWSEELDIDTDESYTLTIPISGNSVINSSTVFGALRAIETFSQIVQWSSVHNSSLIPNAPWRINGSVQSVSIFLFSIVSNVQFLSQIIQFTSIEVSCWILLVTTTNQGICSKLLTVSG